jgi:hypothetical protein
VRPKRLHYLLVGMLMQASVSAGTPVTLPNADRIQPSSMELERKTQPWCPGDCAIAVPFVAAYRKGAERLVFVGVHHAFQPNDPTMGAVAAGFAATHARVVILEGFPTLMGEDPPLLVQEAHRYGAPDAPDFDRGEAIYAASLALSRGIPFVGGEPSHGEQLEVLKAKGFTEAEIAFSSLLGWFSQALRSGDIPDTSAASLAKVYPRSAEDVNRQWHLEAPTLDEFREHYRDLYGIDIVGDDQFPLRIEIGDPTRHGQQLRVDMMTRDRHLLGLIEQQLAERHSVLVVFGGSHWSTLSAALEARLGKPKVRAFLK